MDLRDRSHVAKLIKYQREIKMARPRSAVISEFPYHFRSKSENESAHGYSRSGRAKLVNGHCETNTRSSIPRLFSPIAISLARRSG